MRFILVNSLGFIIKTLWAAGLVQNGGEFNKIYYIRLAPTGECEVTLALTGHRAGTGPAPTLAASPGTDGGV